MTAFGIALLALTLRVAYHVEMRGNPLVEHLQLDELYHDRWAESIAAGDFVGSQVFFRAPLYPYAVGIIYSLFGHTADIIRVLQHLLGAASVFLVYVIARSLFSKTAAVVGSLLLAFYGVMIFFEGRLLFDSPLAFLVLLWLALAIHTQSKPDWKRMAMSGGLAGLICIMRPTFLVLAPFLFFLLFWFQIRTSRQRLPSLAALVVSFLVPIAVVTLRNGMVGGDFVLIASQGGINYYIGNNPQADGMSSWIPELGEVWGQNKEVEFAAKRETGQNDLTPSQVSSFWYSKAWSFARNQPLEFIQLQLKKLYLFWTRIEIPNNLSYYWFERESRVLSFLPVGFWLVAPLGIAGALLSRTNHRAWLLLVFLLLYWLVTSAFFVADRFRVPAIPVLCLFAGYAVSQGWELLRARRWQQFAVAVLFLLVGIFLVNTNLAGVQRDVGAGDDGIKGRAALESGDLRTAAELLGRAAQLDPLNSSTQINYGATLWRLGRTSEAADAFRAASSGNPYLAQVNLAHLFYNEQQTDSAAFYAGQAIRSRPFAPGGYIISAKTHLVDHNMIEAELALKRGREACGEDFLYGDYLLAGIHLQTGRLASADSMYRNVLRRVEDATQPEYSIGTEKEQFGEDLHTLRAKSHHGIARALAASGKLGDSEHYFRTAANLLPAKPDIWADWGVCLMRLNRLAEADTVMRRVVSMVPGNPAAWLNFATLLARRGDLQSAERAAQQALYIRPDFPEANALLHALRSGTQGR